MKRLLHYISWPVVCGLLAAAVILLAFPQLTSRPPQAPMNTSELAPANGHWSGPASYSDAVSRAAPSVVNIYTHKELQRAQHPLLDDPLFRRFFNSSNQPRQKRMLSSLGSGVIVDQSGYVLTNNHVVSEADEIIALLHDGREAKARVIGNDPETDLAVLKIEVENPAAINIGEPSQASVGDVVLAIGNPFGVGQSVSQGIISATGRNGLGLNTFENFIQTDAAINPGNSGGALVDAYGNLLGINSAILDGTGYSVGVGFAIPADTAMKVLNDIVQHGRVIRGWLGVEASALSQQLATRLGIDPPQGLLITNIYNQGPAHIAGVLPGDVIVRINSYWAWDNKRSMNLVARLAPGDPVNLELWRKGEILKVTAIAGTRPTPR